MTDDDPTAQKRTVRRGYDDLADAYDASRESGTGGRPALDELFDRLAPGSRLLDAGCGAGKGVLAELDGDAPADPTEAVGLDVSATQVGLARERTEAAVCQGDMTRLPFQADTFDALTAFYAIIHVPIDEHGRCYREFARVLRPGGWLLLTVADDVWVGSNDDWLDSGTRMEWSYPPIEESEDLAREAGFEVVERIDQRSEMDEVDWPFLLCRLEE